MKILVTGSKGFVGKHLVKHLQSIGHDVIEMDLKDGMDILTENLPEVDKVFHLAAQTDAASEDAYTDASTNILGTIRLLERYREKLIFAATCMSGLSHCPYSISKTAAEAYCKLYGATIVRFCNLFGEGGHCVINKFREGQVMNIRGDGKQLRTYASVESAVHMLVHAMMMSLTEKGYVHTLPGKDMTVLQVADMFPNKERVFVEPVKYDVSDARQYAI